MKAALLLLAATVASAQTAAEVQAWLKAVDDARNALGEAKISARASRIEEGKVAGTADFDIYIKGRDKALIVFRGGKNDGRKALTVGDKMWLLVPGAEHPVPITANQRLMGGASFGDVARIRFADDFTATARPGIERWGARLPRARPDRGLDEGGLSEGDAVARCVGRAAAAQARLLPALRKAAREVRFTKFRKVQGRNAVAEMEIQDLFRSKTQALTRLEYLDIQPAKIDDAVFTPDGAGSM
jgi:hypothetical protein